MNNHILLRNIRHQCIRHMETLPNFKYTDFDLVLGEIEYFILKGTMEYFLQYKHEPECAFDVFNGLRIIPTSARSYCAVIQRPIWSDYECT